MRLTLVRNAGEARGAIGERKGEGLWTRTLDR